jgi:hypothetical protein
MLPEEATAENPQLNLPDELLAEIDRGNGGRRPTDFRVDGWKPSLVERLARLLGFG